MPRKTNSTARKTPARKAKTAAAAKKAPVFEARIGDRKSLDAAKAAGEAARKAIAERNTAIVAAVNGGTSARQVAIAVGLTHAAVLKIKAAS
jgi:hypothetical protein